MKKRICITIEAAVLRAAKKHAKTHYEVGTFSHMVAMGLVAMMEKAVKK